MRWIVYIFFLFVLIGCKRGDHQVILLKNRSSEDIYFLISGNRMLSNLDDISTIRPTIPIELDKRKINYKDLDEQKKAKQTLFRYLIEKDSLEVILTSGSVGVFVDAVTIKSIIKDRFDGQLNIFIITENDLEKYSDQEIIDQKLYRFFKTLTIGDIKADTITLEYP